jgi:hypothetical protein
MVSGFPEQRLDGGGKFGNLSSFLGVMAVTAERPRFEPLHERCDRSGEKDHEIDQREESTHILSAAADEQLLLSRFRQQCADATFPPNPIFPLPWSQCV